MDVNCDLGEGFGVWHLTDDDDLLDVVTSANVACGFHAGDASIMRQVCTGAARRGVAIGAQVSYRDLAGFGRRRMDVAPAELTDDVLYQLGALSAFAQVAGTRVSYLKPHGALYHTVVADEGQARAVVQAVQEWGDGLAVLGAPRSLLLRFADEAGVAVFTEAFVDRAYAADGSLVPRGVPGAVLADPGAVVAQAVRLATSGEVVAIDGSTLRLAAHSLCLHGDTPGAAGLARDVRGALRENGIPLARFTSP
ncbi:MAG: LamB/YcsF family protein [Actinomycetota bacterium]